MCLGFPDRATQDASFYFCHSIKSFFAKSELLPSSTIFRSCSVSSSVAVPSRFFSAIEMYSESEKSKIDQKFFLHRSCFFRKDCIYYSCMKYQMHARKAFRRRQPVLVIHTVFPPSVAVFFSHCIVPFALLKFCEAVFRPSAHAFCIASI